MRVPQYIRKDIQALIDMYAHWCASDEEPVLVSKTSVEQRLKTIEFLHYVTEYEKSIFLIMKNLMIIKIIRFHF